MSGIEILGIAASVIQIADLGGKLSVKLFVFSRKIKNADKSIDSISQDIAATGAVLQQLGNELAKDKHLRLCSDDAVLTAQRLVDDCNKVFLELYDALDGGASNNTLVMGWKQRLKYPFLEPQIELLRTNLERLKSSLVVMLNVLIFAGQLRNQETLEVLKDQKELVKTLVEDKNASEKKYRLALKAIEGLAAMAPSMAPSMETSREVVEPLPAKVAKPVPKAFRTNFVSKTVPSESVATTKPEMSPVQLWSLPSGLRYRSEEIQHHCALIKSLLAEVSAVKYQIDHGFRDRLHRGVLGAHWEQWAPLRELYGDEALINAFSTHQELVRFWVSKLEAEALGQLTNRRNILSIRDVTPVEGTVEMSPQSVIASTAPRNGSWTSDTAFHASPEEQSTVDSKREPAEAKGIAGATIADSDVSQRRSYGQDSTKRHAIHGLYSYGSLPVKNTSLVSPDIGEELKAVPEKRSDADVNHSPPTERTGSSEGNIDNIKKPASPVPKATSSEESYYPRTTSSTVIGIGQSLAAADRAQRPKMDALGGSRLALGNPPMPNDSVAKNDPDALEPPSNVKATDAILPAPEVLQSVSTKLPTSDASRQKAKARPPIAVVGRMSAAVTGLYKNTRRSKNKAAAEEMRRNEVEEYYSFNPNDDPTMKSVGNVPSPPKYNTYEDDSGYRGWGNASLRPLATSSASTEDYGVGEKGQIMQQEQAPLPSKALEEDKPSTTAASTKLSIPAVPKANDLQSHESPRGNRPRYPPNATTTKASLDARAKFQFEADSEDDLMEDEIAANLVTLGSANRRLEALARATGEVVELQNMHLHRISDKADRVDDTISLNTARLKRLDGNGKQASTTPAKKGSADLVQDAKGNFVSFKSGDLSFTKQEIGRLKTKDEPPVRKNLSENTPLNDQGPVPGSGLDQGNRSDAGRPPRTDEGEEDFMPILEAIRSMKQQDVSSTRNALRVAAEAEQTGPPALSRLGLQGKASDKPVTTAKPQALHAQSSPIPLASRSYVSYVSNLRSQSGITKVDKPSSPGTDGPDRQQLPEDSSQAAASVWQSRPNLSGPPTRMSPPEIEAAPRSRSPLSATKAPGDENEDRSRADDATVRNEDNPPATAHIQLPKRPAISIYSPAMGTYVGARPYSDDDDDGRPTPPAATHRGGDDDIPRPVPRPLYYRGGEMPSRAAPSPKNTDPKPAPARGAHHTYGPEPVFPFSAEPTGEAAASQEEHTPYSSTGESKPVSPPLPVMLNRSRERPLTQQAQVQSPQHTGPAPVEHHGLGPRYSEQQGYFSTRPTWSSARRSTSVYPSQGNDDDDDSTQTQNPKTEVHVPAHSESFEPTKPSPGDPAPPALYVEDHSDGKAEGETEGNFDTVDELLMQWTQLSRDEYMALQHEGALL